METKLEKQTRWIASAYNGIGLYSIPCLTLVTVISMTNVFTSGYFSQYPFIGGLWAFIFAATIDVNIVRLFLESHCEKVKGRVSSARTTFWVALGLSIVTGVALLVEGLQQSVGLSWSDGTVRGFIGLIIALRVVLVVVLMAREGCKLGASLVQHEQELTEATSALQATVEQFAVDKDVDKDEQLSDDEDHTIVDITDYREVSIEAQQPAQQKLQRVTTTSATNAKQKAQRILKRTPDISATELAKKVGISRQYASKIMAEIISA